MFAFFHAADFCNEQPQVHKTWYLSDATLRMPLWYKYSCLRYHNKCPFYAVWRQMWWRIKKWRNLWRNVQLASCPWGPVTAYRVDVLTEMYVIYMERSTSHRAIRILKIRPLGPLGAAGAGVTYAWKEGWKEGRKARKYIRMWCSGQLAVIIILTWFMMYREILHTEILRTCVFSKCRFPAWPLLGFRSSLLNSFYLHPCLVEMLAKCVYSNQMNWMSLSTGYSQTAPERGQFNHLTLLMVVITVISLQQ